MADVLSDDYEHPSNNDVLSEDYKPSVKGGKSYYPSQEPINLLDRFKRAASIAGQDITNIPGNLLRGASKFINVAPTEIPAGTKQYFTEPVRAGRNIGYGVGEIARDAQSAMPNTTDYLAKQMRYAGHLGLIPKKYAESLDINEKNPVEFLKPESNKPGDVGLQTLPKLLFGLLQDKIPGIETVKALPEKILGKENPVINAKSAELEGLTEKAQQEVDRLTSEAFERKKAHAEAVGEAKRKTNVANEDTMEFALNKQHEDILNAHEKSKQLDENLANIEPAPEAPVAPEEQEITPPVKKNLLEPQKPEITPPEEPTRSAQEHVLASEKAADEAQQVEDLAKQAKEHHENVSKLDEEADKNIAEHLDLGSAHHLHVGRFLKNAVEAIEKKAKKSFKELIEKIKDSQFKMPNSIPFKIDMENVLRQLKAGKDPTKLSNAEFDNPFLKDLVSKAPTSKDVMASEFITKYQDWRDARYKLKSDMKYAKTAEERRQMAEAYEKSEELDSIIKKTLSEGLGPFKQEWDKVNNTYSKVVYPLRGNSVVKKAVKTGKLSEQNMASQLSGDEQGMDILRDLVKSNPEALKHVVGQRYEAGASKVHNPNEILSEYTEQMPELKQMLQGKKAAESLKNEAATRLENVKEQHEKAKNKAARLKNTAVRAGREETRTYKEYQDRKKAYDNEIKSYEKSKKQYEADVKQEAKEQKAYETKLTQAEKEKATYKESVAKHEKAVKDREKKVADAEKAIEDHQSNIEKMEKRAELLNEQMPKVRNEANKVDATLEQKFKAGLQLKKLKRELRETNKQMSESTTGLKKAILVAKTLYKLGLKINRIK